MSNSSIPSPEEATARMWAWGEEDFCFHVLRLLVETRGDADLQREVLDHLNEHYEECGSCWQNVLMAADNCTDPFRRRVYWHVYHLSLFELMRAHGGDAVVTQEAEGQRISVKYPSYMDEPWVGGEVYVPSSLTHEALIILDVRDEGLFRDPRPVLQRLDEISAFEVQDFDRPMGRGIQWWTITGDRPSRLLVRCQGETRSVAADWTLVSRYKRLVAKHDGEVRLAEDLTGKVALTLRELALKYDGRSRFSGHLEKTLEYRAKDAWRHDAKDAFGNSEVAELDRRRCVDDSQGSLRVPKRILEEATIQSQLKEEKLFEGLDLSMFRKRLTKRQQRILALKVDGLSDEAVGARLGLRRETVNREMNEIKKAARLKI